MRLRPVRPSYVSDAAVFAGFFAFYAALLCFLEGSVGAWQICMALLIARVSARYWAGRHEWLRQAAGARQRPADQAPNVRDAAD